MCGGGPSRPQLISDPLGVNHYYVFETTPFVDDLPPLPQVPDLTSSEQADVLVSYAQTMWYVQRFENTLKFFMFLTKTIDSEMNGELTDADIRRFSEGAKQSAMGQALRNVRKWSKAQGIDIIPPEADEIFTAMVVLRNHLAHRYLLENWRLLAQPEARRMLIGELTHFARVYAGIDESWRPWTSSAMAVLGLDYESVQASALLHTDDLDDERFQDLKGRLKALGLKGFTDMSNRADG